MNCRVYTNISSKTFCKEQRRSNTVRERQIHLLALTRANLFWVFGVKSNKSKIKTEMLATRKKEKGSCRERKEKKNWSLWLIKVERTSWKLGWISFYNIRVIILHLFSYFYNGKFVWLNMRGTLSNCSYCYRAGNSSIYSTVSVCILLENYEKLLQSKRGKDTRQDGTGRNKPVWTVDLILGEDVWRVK